MLFRSKALLAHRDVDPIVERDGLAEIIGLGPSRTPGHGWFVSYHKLSFGHCE